MRKRIYLELNENETRILQKVAELHGFRDYHIWLHREIHSLPHQIKKEFICKKTGSRATKAIAISDDVLNFYERLSCSHSTNPTSIVSKYIVYPFIKDFMLKEDPTKGPAA